MIYLRLMRVKGRGWGVTMGNPRGMYICGKKNRAETEIEEASEVSQWERGAHFFLFLINMGGNNRSAQKLKNDNTY